MKQSLFYRLSFRLNNFQLLPFWVQAILVLLFVNIIIFIIKILIFGFKTYYFIQLIISLLIFVFIKKRYFSLQTMDLNKMFISTLESVNDSHRYHFGFYNTKFACYNTAASKWTWLFTFWNLFHMCFVSILALTTWNCTMYVRISFALCFIFFIIGIISLKIQSRENIPLIVESKTVKGNSIFFVEKEILTLSALIPSSIKQYQTMSYVKTLQHTFHILLASLWPVFTAYCLFDVLVFIAKHFNYGTICYGQHHFFIYIQGILFILICWFWNVSQESNEGNHTKKVRFNLTHGFILFIISEIMLFFSIFWAFYHSSFSPTSILYCMWPPFGIQPINPWGLPFFNTILLISSGISLTIAHRTVSYNNFFLTSQSLLFTLFLGFSFTFVQLFEYITSTFSINDSVFGSVFFFSTGFHGLHVLVGSFMLIVSLIRNGLRQLFATQHIGFIVSIWYWHFVDVIWVFLFLMVYWWGS